MLSTRTTGLVGDFNSSITSFNYVIARVVLGDEVYLLDATDPYGELNCLPERCLNGKGGVINSEGLGFWIDVRKTNRFYAENNSQVEVK